MFRQWLRDMRLDRELPLLVPMQALREIECGSLPDKVHIVVAEDQEPQEPARRLKALEPDIRQRRPYRHIEQLMRGECGFDAFRYAQFFVWVEQPHRTARDCRNGRQVLFARGYRRVVNPH